MMMIQVPMMMMRPCVGHFMASLVKNKKNNNNNHMNKEEKKKKEYRVVDVNNHQQQQCQLMDISFFEREKENKNKKNKTFWGANSIIVKY